MSKTYRTTVVIDGDSKGGVRAMKLTGKEADRLHKKLRDGSKYSKNYSKSMNGVLGSMTKIVGIGAAVGATFAAFSFVRQIGESIDFADKIQKLSIGIGVSTEALSEYKHVAELSGTSFDVITKSWQRQAKAVSEASEGYGTGKRALEQLNLSAADLKKLDLDKQFEAIAGALNKVESETDKVRIAQDLWGRSGAQLIPMISGGAGAIREMRQEANKLGLTITRDQADAAAAANDNMTRLSAAYRGTAQSMALNLVPSISETIEYFNKMVQKEGVIVGFLETINHAFLDYVLGMETMQQVQDLDKGKIFNQQLKDQITQLDRLTGAVEKAAEELERMTKLHGEDDRMVKLQKKAFGSLMNQYKQTKKEIDETEKALGKINITGKKTGKVFGDLGGDTDDLAKKTRDLTESAEKWYALLVNGAAVEKYFDDLEKLEEVSELLGLTTEETAAAEYELSQKIHGVAKEANKAAGDIGGMNKALEEQQEEAQKAAEEMQRYEESIAGSLTDALMRGFEDGKGMVDAFKDTLINMFKTMVLRPIIQPVSTMMAGGISALLGTPGAASAGGMGIPGMDGTGMLGSLLNSGGLMGALGSGIFSAGMGISGLFGGGLGGAFGSGMAGMGSVLSGNVGIGALMGNIGGLAGAGTSIMATLGAALPILLPALLIPALMSAFGDDNANSRLKVWTGDSPQGGDFKNGKPFSNEREWTQVDTAFGTLGAAGRHIGVANDDQIPQEEFDAWLAQMEQAFEGIAVLDAMLVDVFDLSDETIASITAAVESMEESSEKMGAPDLEAWLTDRYDIVFAGIGGKGQNLYNGMMNTTDVGVTQVVQDLATFFATLESYGNVFTDFDDALAQSKLSLFELGDQQLATINEMVAGFDGSYESTLQLTSAIQQRYQMEMQMLAQIESYIQSTQALTDSSIESIITSQMTQQELYEYNKTQAEHWANQVLVLEDPTAVAEAQKKADYYGNQAWNSLSSEQQATDMQWWIDFFTGVQGEANKDFANANDQIGTDNGDLGTSIDDILLVPIVRLDTVADKESDTADKNADTADKLDALADKFKEFGVDFGDGVVMFGQSVSNINVTVDIDSTGGWQPSEVGG